MTDEPENLVLDLLRPIRGDIAEVRADVIELNERVGLVEAQVASVSRRIDRLGGDVEQIKRHLDLVSA